MTLGHPLVDAALDDLRLSATELRLFRVLWRALDFREFRSQKSEALALRLATDRANVSRALAVLVELGYLEAEVDDARGSIGRYRLAATIPSTRPENVLQKHRSDSPPPRTRRQRHPGL